MIVRACDRCLCLLTDEKPCAFVAVRSGDGIMFKPGQGGNQATAHLCSQECLLGYFMDWVEGKLEPIELKSPTQPLAPTSPMLERVNPDPDRMAETNAILGSVLGRG